MFRSSLFLAAFSTALLFFMGSGCGERNRGDENIGLQHQNSPVIGNPHPGFCPVMGEKVDIAKANEDPALHSDYQGKRYLFCCKMCKPKFDKDPAKYLANPAPPENGEGHSDHASQ